jgi:urea-proton symporter
LSLTNRYQRYASGATVQILLFATLAIELKRRAPNAHTFLEVVHARYGKITHFVFITFGLMTNILVTAMLLTGGSAVASSLTGVPTAAACFLLPVGVVLYTMFGGKALTAYAPQPTFPISLTPTRQA